MAMLTMWGEKIAGLQALPAELKPVAHAIAAHTHTLWLARMLFSGELGPDDSSLLQDIDRRTTEDARDISVGLAEIAAKSGHGMILRVTTPPPEFLDADDEFIWYELPSESTPNPAWTAEDQGVVQAAATVADEIVAWSEERLMRFIEGDDMLGASALLTEFTAAMTLSKIWLWQLDPKLDAPLAEDIAIQLSDTFYENAPDGEAEEGDEGEPGAEN